MAAKETIKFFGKYLRNPRFTGAVCPSWPFLAKRMADGGRAPEGAVVVELGPGTGPVTKYILKSGVAAQNLYSIEFDPHLADGLRRRFPGVNVINGSAEHISECVGENCMRVRSIVSSLPLVSLPRPVVAKILAEVEAVLPAGGRFVQFTYNLKRRPENLGFKRMRHLKRHFVFVNVPPARVDVFEKL